MLQSMTGYGSKSFKIDDFEINIELRTLNSRYFDSKISLPPTLYKHELEIDNLLKKFLLRGKAELNIKLLGISDDSFSFNKNVIKNYFKDLNDISKFDKSQLLNSILNLPNTISKSENKMPEKVSKKITVILNSVIKQLISFRIKEGQNTKKDLVENIKMINICSEKIKKEIGTAIPSTNNTFLMKGRDIRSGTPKEIELTEKDACEALMPILNQILGGIKEALENTPPELSADLIDMGLVLTGGGALLKNIDKLISQDTGLPVTIADDPLSCVAIGTGRALENEELFSTMLSEY